MYVTAAPHFKEKNLSIQDFKPFPWDDLTEEKPKIKQTKTELKEMFSKWDKVDFKEQK